MSEVALSLFAAQWGDFTCLWMSLLSTYGTCSANFTHTKVEETRLVPHAVCCVLEEHYTNRWFVIKHYFLSRRKSKQIFRRRWRPLMQGLITLMYSASSRIPHWLNPNEQGANHFKQRIDTSLNLTLPSIRQHQGTWKASVSFCLHF